MQSWFCLGKLPYIPVNAQAPVCGLYKPPSISPVLMFPNGQEKIKGNSGIHSCNSQINKCKLHFPRNDFVIQKNWRFEEF